MELNRKVIRKYYWIQLLLSFILTLVSVNIIGLINVEDMYSKSRLLLLSILGACLFTILNALINALNFSYSHSGNKTISFDIPIVIWAGISIYNFNQFDLEGFLFSGLCFEALLYNVFLKKTITN